jgi:hypothetical protein
VFPRVTEGGVDVASNSRRPAIVGTYIVASVPDGRAILFPTGGHALVGHYADALRDSTSFLQTVQERRSWRTATSHSSGEAVDHIPF